MRKKADNLSSLVLDLNDNQLAFLCRCVNRRLSGIHRGSLPFVSRVVAIECVKDVAYGQDVTNPIEIRAAKRLLAKFGVNTDLDVLEFEMYLNTTKLVKAAGRKLGDFFIIKLPITVVREVGLRWQEFGKKWTSPEVLLNQNIELQPLGNGLWKVRVPRKMDVDVRMYLFEQFG